MESFPICNSVVFVITESLAVWVRFMYVFFFAHGFLFVFTDAYGIIFCLGVVVGFGDAIEDWY